MTDDKLHKILKFITQEFKELNGVRYKWKYEELMAVISPWYAYFVKNKIRSKHVVRNVCRPLETDKIISEIDDFSFDIINITKAYEYRDNKLYKEKTDVWTRLKDIAAIAAVVLAFVVFFQDRRVDTITTKLQQLRAHNDRSLSQKDSIDSLLLKKKELEIGLLKRRLDSIESLDKSKK